MSELIIRAAKLVPYSKRFRTLPGQATAYFYEPDLNDDTKLGCLFVVVESLGKSKQTTEVIDLIIQAAGESYYNDDEAAPEPAIRFEAAVKSVNRELTNYLNQGNGSWVGKLSAVIAILAGNELNITQTGSAQAFLYRNGKSTLVTNSDEKNKEYQPLKTFASIASGTVEVEDRLLFATPALLHSISKLELKDIIHNSAPSIAIQKITDLLTGNDSNDRIAAIIVEVTTAELLANQHTTEGPNEITLGRPDSVVEAAGLAMAQLGAKASPISKKVGIHSSRLLQDNLLPNLRSGGLWLAARLRKFLRDPGASKRLAITGVVILLLLLLFALLSGQHAKTATTDRTLHNIVSEEQVAKTQILNGDKASAIVTLQNAQQSLEQLEHNGNPNSSLNNDLQSLYPKGSANSASLSVLTSQINRLIDQADNIKTVDAADVVNFSTIKGANPTHFVLAGEKIIAFDGNNSSIYSYDMSDKTLSTPVSDPTELGKVVAATSADSGSEVYILTNTPSVWLYEVSSGSLSRVQLSYGAWPAGSDIAAYYSNLYILTSANIYKYVPTVGGFSAGELYLSSAVAAGAQGATRLAVDGSIILGGSSNGLQRYMLGKLAQNLSSLPASLSHPVSVQSYSNGSSILIADGGSQRLGVVSFDGTNLALAEQYEVSNISTVYAAQADSNGTTIYVLTSRRIVSFSP